MRPIGYYVHHHGDGHRQRARALAQIQPERFTLIGTGLAGRTGKIAAIDLPDDRMMRSKFDGADGEAQRPHAFHYAPLAHDGVRSRMGEVAAWIAANKPSLMIVDVSVEIALLARLCATPVAYVRLSGERTDQPHLEAFRAASVLIAPFAKALDDPKLPEWIRRKTVYAPGVISRHDACPQRRRILVVVGRGGTSVLAADIVAAALTMKDYSWRVIGMPAPDQSPANVAFVEWTDDPLSEIARAEVVIGGAGDGLVGAVIAARRPFICIPEPRPFDEQKAKASALGEIGAAIIRERWPSESEWTEMLNEAYALDPSVLQALDDANGAAYLMHVLRSVADR